MKQYQIERFEKNGVSVNTVYVVKPGDTISGIRKTVKRLGGDPKDLEKVDPNFLKGLAPGQFVYFNSKLPRAEEFNNKVIHTHELERCPYKSITVFKTNFKEKIDNYVGYSNAWKEVLSLNRIDPADFETKDKVDLKIYHSKKVFDLGTTKGQLQKNNLDQQLAKNIEVVTEKVLISAERAPASEESHGPGGPVYIGMIVLVAALVLAYRSSKKKIALDSTDQ